MLVLKESNAINLDITKNFYTNSNRIIFTYTHQEEYCWFQFESEEKAREAFKKIINSRKKGESVCDLDVLK